jgi:hypothetical protein
MTFLLLLLLLLNECVGACVKTTHAFVAASGVATPLSAAVVAGGRGVVSRAIDCADRANLTLQLVDSETTCQFVLNGSLGLRVQCEGDATTTTATATTSTPTPTTTTSKPNTNSIASRVLRVNVTLERVLWFAGLTFDAKSFRRGGALRSAGAQLLANISQIDPDGTWSAFTYVAESDAAFAMFRPATAFLLALPADVLLHAVVLRVPTDAELAGNVTRAPPPGSLAPQSWVEQNSALAIGLGSLGLFALLASAFFGAVFVWYKRRKTRAERNEMALYGASADSVGGGGGGGKQDQRRSSVSNVVMVDTTDDRVTRSTSAHALLSQSLQNQDAPSVRYET